MKCPYAVHRYEQTKTEIEYDSESKEENVINTTASRCEFVDCLKEQCGAYNSTAGRCEYSNH